MNLAMIFQLMNTIIFLAIVGIVLYLIIKQLKFYKQVDRIEEMLSRRFNDDL